MSRHSRLSKLAISSVQSLKSYTTRPWIQQTTRQLFTQRSILYGNKTSPNPLNPLNQTGRRCYYVDRNQVHHFRPRGPERWFQDRRKVLVVVIVSSGVLISVFFGNIETIPYTKRNHFVLLSTNAEKQLGEREFENLKKQFKGKILPGIHPQSVRVRLIAKDVIEALHRGIKQDRVWSYPSYSETGGFGERSSEEIVMAVMGADNHTRDGKIEGRDSWRKDEEVLNDKWVQKSRKKGKEREVATKHLDGLNWEVLLVDEPMVNAFCLPGGKIVVFTGLLKHFTTDAEIATIIGHEVGHAVARHSAEGITKNMWVAIIQIILLQFVSMPDLINATSQLLLRLPFSRRMEMEADYIGLLLIASAGYDPRIAPMVYEKLGQIGGDSPIKDYLSTHPSGKRRARVLAQARVMEEALTIYRDVREGRMVQDFL